MRMCEGVCVHPLLWFEGAVDDAQPMEVTQGQGKLRQIQLPILLGEHHLGNGTETSLHTHNTYSTRRSITGVHCTAHGTSYFHPL